MATDHRNSLGCNVLCHCAVRNGVSSVAFRRHLSYHRIKATLDGTLTQPGRMNFQNDVKNNACVSMHSITVPNTTFICTDDFLQHSHA